MKSLSKAKWEKLLLILTIGMFALSSCEKCGHCDGNGVGEVVCGKADIANEKNSCDYHGGTWVED